MPSNAPRLVHITHGFPPPFDEGSINYQIQILRSLNAFRVEVLCGSRDRAASTSGFDAALGMFVTRRRLFNMSSLSRIVLRLPAIFILCLSHVARVRPSLLSVGYVLPFGPIALLAKLLFGVPYMVFIYGEEVQVWCRRSAFRRKLIQSTLHHADVVLTVSENSIRLVRENAPRLKGNIHKVAPISTVALNALADESLEDIQATRDVARRPSLLTVSRLEERKGQDVVLRALAPLVEDFPDVHYDIVGKGAHEESLRQLVSQLGLEGHVTFHGFTSLEKLDGLYRAASLFVLANRELPNGDSEGCPTVLLDASAYGLPTIAGHYGGTDDGVRQDETGLLVESKDHLRVGEALRGLLADEARRKTFGRNGRRFVRELSLGPALNSLQSELARVARAGEIQK